MAQESTHLRDGQHLGGGGRSPLIAIAGTERSRPFAVGDVSLANNVFLAPLSGISDVPFRTLARRFGAGMVVSEMVASAEFVHGHPESDQRAMRDGAGTHVVQLAGRDPEWMRRAAAKLEALGADIIDINMGCPAKKVVGGLSGSALMREPDLALRIVDAVVAGAGTVPVTLKMRLGWDADSLNAPAIAVRAQAAGVRMITVHGRTRAQFYTGQADWRAIRAVKAAVSVPVVANGDLVECRQLPDILGQSGADAVMIGRGAQGRPWAPGLLAGAITVERLARVAVIDVVLEHYDGILRHYGRPVGVRAARKHIGWYLDRLGQAGGPASGSDRSQLLNEEAPDKVTARLRALFGATSLADMEDGRDHRHREAA